jgi:uroporphyrinogen III methyltransferase/synthase
MQGTTREGRASLPRRPRIFFVGAGPGDPRLVTVRAAEVLGLADAVLYDAKVHPSVLDQCRPACVRTQVGADGLARADEVAARLVAHALAGKLVVRLFWGDPFLFASGDVEAFEVGRAGQTFEVVPGIVAAVALGAYAGLTLSRNVDASPSVALVDTRGGISLHDWTKLAEATDTLVLIVGKSELEDLTRTLIFYGRLPTTPAAIITDVTLPSQRVITGTLEDICRRTASHKLEFESVRLVVGDVASRREGLRWFDARPLFGKRVLVTRTRLQAESAAALLRERGAEPVIVPTIELGAPRDVEPMRRALANLSAYDWVAFTSANGVERAWAELLAAGRDARAFGGSRVAAIGPATAEALHAHGIAPDVVAKEFRGEGLASEILRVVADEVVHGPGPPKKVLILRAQEARDALPQALRQAGCEVEVVAVYETRPAQGAREALQVLTQGGALDAVTFTSSSTVDNLCDMLGPTAPALLRQLRLASIGPITTSTAEKRGLRVDVTAAVYTLPGLIDALEASYI